MKWNLLLQFKNYIKYKTPWKYCQYNKQLYKNDKFRIEYFWRRENHFAIGFYYDGNFHTEVWSNNESWFVNKIYINFIYASFLIVTKKKLYCKYPDDYFDLN